MNCRSNAWRLGEPKLPQNPAPRRPTEDEAGDCRQKLELLLTRLRLNLCLARLHAFIPGAAFFPAE
jgi:hypothetical protein